MLLAIFHLSPSKKTGTVPYLVQGIRHSRVYDHEALRRLLPILKGTLFANTINVPYILHVLSACSEK